MTITYTVGAEDPSSTFTWRDSTGAVIDFSDPGWTFTLRLGFPDRAADLEKTDGITGAATAPNITVVWAVDELDTLTPGTRVLQLWPRKDGRDRAPLTELFTILAPVTAAAS